MSETYSLYPGWQATSSSGQQQEKKKVLNADGAISAIALRGDEQQVTLTYKPRFYTASMIVSVLTFIAVIGYLAFMLYTTYYPIKQKQSGNHNDGGTADKAPAAKNTD